MYIKQVVIENFKSYKGYHVLEGLDPRHNAIVGRNGSGKSSLLDSIAFVLSSHYYPSTKDQRKIVINDDDQNLTRSASVELILADPDNLLSLSSPEIQIRRVVSMEYDNITINHIKSSPSELFNLLALVIPRENPYYIVRQDEVALLATGKDSARFDVISKAIGVYKFQEELDKLLDEVKKREKILKKKQNDVTSHLEKLEKMNDRYNRWHEVNKKKRYLEHKLCELNKNTLRDQLSNLLDPCEEESTKAERARRRYNIINAKYHSLSEEASVIQSDIDHLEAIKKKTRDEDVQLSNQFNTLKHEEREMTDRLERFQLGELETFTQQQVKVVSKITELEDQCKSIETMLNDTRETLEYNETKLESNDCKLVALHRQKKFVQKLASGDANVSDIFPRLSQFDRTIDLEEAAVAEGEGDVIKALEQKERLQKKLTDLRNQLNTTRLQLRDQKLEKEKLQKVNDSYQSQRKEKQREADKFYDKISTLQKNLFTLKRRLNSVISVDLLEGIESVNKIIDMWRDEDRVHDVEGIKGLLLDLFTCNEPSILFPMQVKGGEQLFYHVVRDRQLISDILNKMTANKLPGIINFIPLEDITISQVQYPNEDGCIPIICHLMPIDNDMDSKKAVNFVFGNTVVVRDLEIGINITNQYKFQSITLDGQQVLAQGQFRGGYRDRNVSQVTIYKQFVAMKDKIKEQKTEYKNTLYRIQSIDGELISSSNKLQALDRNIDASEREISNLQIDIAKSSRAIDDTTEAYNGLKMMWEISKVRLEQIRQEKCNATLEDPDLTQIDVPTLDESMDSVTRESISLKKQQTQLKIDVPRLETELQALKKSLEQHQKNKDDLEENAQDYSVDFHRDLLTLIKMKMKKCIDGMKSANEKLVQSNILKDNLLKELAEIEKSLAEINLKKEAALLAYKGAKEDAAVMKSKCISLEHEIAEWMEKSSYLGTIPVIHDTRQFDNLNKKSLEKRIRDLVKEEDRLGVVTRFNDSVTALQEDLNALEMIQKKVENGRSEYVRRFQRINAEKIEALRIGFQVINEHFKEIFGEIVANGRANLYPVDANGQEFDDVHWERVNGIRMRVTFVGGRQMDRMYELSGGQKTVIALTLILAVHQYRPGPFYLFDEIDKALDGIYRASVAELVHELSRNAQFLTITFKGELLMNADEYFKVTARHDCSHVEGCSKEEALDFVRKNHGRNPDEE